MKQGRPRTLDTKIELFIRLCRIRQGFREQHLANLFGISISTVCRNFIYLRLGSLNIWPDREPIDTHMPESIKSKYPSLVLVSKFFFT